MSGDIGSYENEIWKSKGFHLNYPPGQPLKLGDIVVQNRGIWIPIANVAEQLDIAIDKLEEPDADPWVMASETGIEVVATAKAETADMVQVLGNVSADAAVRFTGANRFLLSMKGVRVTRVKDVDAFWAAIKKKRSLWSWDRRRRIITTLVEAGSATFLASGGGDKTYDLKAAVDLKSNLVRLADLGAGFSLVDTFSTAESFVGRKNVQPLFRLHKVTVLTNPGEAASGNETLTQTRLVEVNEEPGTDDGDA